MSVAHRYGRPFYRSIPFLAAAKMQANVVLIRYTEKLMSFLHQGNSYSRPKSMPSAQANYAPAASSKNVCPWSRRRATYAQNRSSLSRVRLINPPQTTTNNDRRPNPRSSGYFHRGYQTRGLFQG